MSKANELKNSFSSSRKALKKPSLEDIERITSAVEKKKTISLVEEETIKSSIDFPATMFKDMKIKLLNSRTSMKAYILSLVEKDLYSRK